MTDDLGAQDQMLQAIGENSPAKIQRALDAGIKANDEHLIIALNAKDAEIARMLLEHGADPGADDALPLRIAAAHGLEDPRLLDVLLTHGGHRHVSAAVARLREDEYPDEAAAMETYFQHWLGSHIGNLALAIPSDEPSDGTPSLGL